MDFGCLLSRSKLYHINSLAAPTLIKRAKIRLSAQEARNKTQDLMPSGGLQKAREYLSTLNERMVAVLSRDLKSMIGILGHYSQMPCRGGMGGKQPARQDGHRMAGDEGNSSPRAMVQPR